MNVAMEQWSCGSVNNQRIVLSGAGNGYYTLGITASNDCVDVEDGALGDGVWLVRIPCDGRTSQKWLPVPQNDGTYLLINALSSKCADVDGQSTSNGALLQQYVCNGGGNQRWHLNAPL